MCCSLGILGLIKKVEANFLEYRKFYIGGCGSTQLMYLLYSVAAVLQLIILLMLRTDLDRTGHSYSVEPSHITYFDLTRSAPSGDVKEPLVPLPRGRVGKAVRGVRPSPGLHIPQQIVVEARFTHPFLPSQNHLVHRRRSGCHVCSAVSYG